MFPLYPRVTCCFAQCEQYSHIPITGVPLAPLNNSLSRWFKVTHCNVGICAEPFMITCVKRHLIVYLPCWLALPVMAVGSSEGKWQEGQRHADDVRHTRRGFHTFGRGKQTEAFAGIMAYVNSNKSSEL